MPVKKKAAKKRLAPYDLDTEEGQAAAMTDMICMAQRLGARCPHEAVRLLMNTAKSLSDLLDGDEFRDMIEALETVEAHVESLTPSDMN